MKPCVWRSSLVALISSDVRAFWIIFVLLIGLNHFCSVQNLRPKVLLGTWTNSDLNNTSNVWYRGKQACNQIGWTRRRWGLYLVLVMSRSQFCPSRIEVSPQTVAGFADWRIVFVKSDAIFKYQADVGAEILSSFVSEINKGNNQWHPGIVFHEKFNTNQSNDL